MKKNIILLGILLSLSFAGSCRSKTVIKKLTSNQSIAASNSRVRKTKTNKLDGVIYRLPRTLIKVTIPVKKATKSPGELSKFTPCFFTSESDLGEWIKEESTRFNVTPPTFTTRGIPDLDETYVVKTKGGYFETKSLLMDYSPDYVPNRVESVSKDDTLDFAVKALRVGVGIAARATSLVGAGGVDVDLNEKILSDCDPDRRIEEYLKRLEEVARNRFDKAEKEFNNESDPVKKKALAEIVNSLRKAHDKTVEDNSAIVDLRKNPPVLSSNAANRLNSEFKVANDMFKRYKTLEFNRELLLSSKATNVPAETLKQQLAELDKLIAAYRSAFLGYKDSDTWQESFEYDPDGALASQLSPLIFSYSATEGVCSDGMIEANSITIKSGFEFADCKTDNNPHTAVWMRVERNDKDSAFQENLRSASNLSGETDKSRGWYYRIPAKGIVWLKTGKMNRDKINFLQTFNGTLAGLNPVEMKIKVDEFERVEALRQLGRDEKAVAQLGVTASVPASTAGRSSTQAITFDPATGAMLNYKVSSDPALNQALLDEVDKTAQSVIDASDGVKKKERELKLLQLQNQINEEREKMNETNNSNTAPANNQPN